MMPPIETLLPHRAPMILLDAVAARDDGTLVAAVTIGPHSLFAEAEGVPAYVGLEYMAQACAAYVGGEAMTAGEAVRVGFLLGTRQYLIHTPWFRLGDHLSVAVSLIYRDESMATFDGKITIGDALAAEARLVVYQPPETLVGPPAERPA
jgi:predicted hotdog family 3-hydroxylacyl-ACP dehydratase